MDIILGQQIFLACIFLLLIISNQFDVRNKTMANTLMDDMFLCGFIKILCAMATTILHGNQEWVLLNTIFTAGDFGCGIPMIILLLYYASEISENRNLIDKRIVKACYVYCIVLILFDISSVFTNSIFSCANGVYKPGEFFYEYHILMALAIVMVMAILYVYKKQFTIRQFVALMLYSIMPLFGSILRMFVSDKIEVGNMSITLGIMIVYITIHIERGRIIAEKEKEMTEARISIMLSQIQPHFLYNSLNTLQYLCKTDPNEASKAIGSFAKYLRGNMDSLNQSEPIELIDDVEHLKNYLILEKLRFPDIEINFDLQCTNFCVPPLTLQPLVENAIKHGVRQLEEGGEINISSWEDRENYYLQVADNGGGFDPNLTPKADGRTHIGLKNTKNRLESMCNGYLSVNSKVGQTIIKIIIPKGSKS